MRLASLLLFPFLLAATSSESPQKGLPTLHKAGEPSLVLTPKLSKREPRYEAIKDLARFNARSLWDGPRPLPDDVRQGSLGTCYFLATLSAYAHADPESLKGLFARNLDGTLALDGDGRAQVMFYRRTDGGGHVRDVVPITAEIPVDKNGIPLFAKIVDEKLWVASLEKAYAVWNDRFPNTPQRTKKKYAKKGWNRISGGWPHVVMEALTGVPAEHVKLNADPASAQTAYDRIHQAVADGRMVAADSVAVKAMQLYERVKTARTSNLVSSNEPLHLPADHIVGNHAYTVLDAFEEDGQRYIKLRNPWGYRHHLDRGSGTFDLTIEKFVLLFHALDVAGSGAPTSA